MSEVRIKRIYDAPTAADGFRVLVDRIWPRGVSKERAALDEWARDLAPSAALRKWFSHDPARWDEFRQRYRAELAGRTEELAALREQAADRLLTLVFSARDAERNQAVVLREVLEGDAPD